MKILAFNAGSSTLKFGLFDPDQNRVWMRGMLDHLGTDEATCSIDEDCTRTTDSVGGMRLPDAVKHVLDRVGKPDGIGCRVVHGADQFDKAVLMTSDVVSAIRDLAPLAPLHNARDIDVIHSVQKLCPDRPLAAVFDTSFHRTMPQVAVRYAIPSEHAEERFVRRFGFHGISYRFIVDRMEEALGTQASRIVACHLGNGASVCAILNGTSIDTSMGMTPLEGLVMGTRSGDIDPGAVLFLMREAKMTIKQVDDLLNHESGLLGLSRKSSDLREVEEAASQGDTDCEFALDAFAYRAAKYVGAYTVALGGLDALVFSGGIGEHSREMRRRICRRLGALGIDEPEDLTGRAVSTCLSGSRTPSIWVVRTDEERQIAVETLAVMTNTQS
ncbi:MAG: acetate/propionate family kinase [Fimbriimonas sp.]|nr:acetate/propionate family kinase [Fimbriimonas sp.]